jgi:hypothetical protein
LPVALGGGARVVAWLSDPVVDLSALLLLELLLLELLSLESRPVRPW